MSTIPLIGFPQVAGHIQRNARMPANNPHHALFGFSGSGKSHMIRYGILPAYGVATPVVVLDVKAGGDTEAWAGWGNDVSSAAELPEPLNLGPDGTPHWRLFTGAGLTRDDVAPVLERLRAEGECVIVMDDAASITDPAGQRGGMGLGGTVDKILQLGRSSSLALVLGLTSTAWANSGAKNLCGTTWVGYTQAKTMRGEFADVAGLDRDEAKALEPPSMRQGRWLYVTTDTQPGPARGTPVRALTEAPAAPPPTQAAA